MVYLSESGTLRSQINMRHQPSQNEKSATLVSMTSKKDPLVEVEKLAGELATIESRRDLAMVKAKAAGKPAQEIADAANISQATFYRVIGTQRDQFADPARYRDYAPSLALDQPDDGLTVAIGIKPDEPPLATFTFDNRHPVLLLLQDNYDDPDNADLWPVIATSVAVSDARVGIYGRRPAGIQSWDLPTYLGVSGDLYDYPAGPERLVDELEYRIERVAAGDDIAPILIMIPGSSKALAVINTALTYGHQARMYLIVETARWHPQWSIIGSTLATGGSVASGYWVSLISASGRGPQMPARFGTAMLTLPEGATEILLPIEAPSMRPEGTGGLSRRGNRA